MSDQTDGTAQTERTAQTDGTQPTGETERTDRTGGDRPRTTGRRWVLAAIVVVVVGLAAVLGAVAFGGSNRDGDRSAFVFEVPAGTGERMDAGEDVALLPERLDLDVGDTIEIQNRDDRVHTVGPYTVAPHQTLRQTFDRPGRVEGPCSLHPSGQVEIVIT